MESYNEAEFKARVDRALDQVRKVLDRTRNPQYAADVPHRYEDKFALVEFMGRVTIASLAQCLTTIGLEPEGLASLCAWSKGKTVTLRLKAREDCAYLREETRKVESETEYVTEKRGFLSGKTTTTEKVITKVTEYFWRFSFEYDLLAFAGADESRAISLLSRRGQIELKTAAKSAPRPQTVVRPAIDVDLTWLLAHLDEDRRARWSIDRAAPDCATPRRNRQVDEALRALDAYSVFFARVDRYFEEELFSAQVDHGLDLSAIRADDVLAPALPLFEASTSSEGLIPASFVHELLAEQERTLVARCRDIAQVFPKDSTVITAVEASLLAVLRHGRVLCRQLWDGVAYVEQMLRRQLVAAIGREISARDFSKYMEFHGRKLLKPAYRPAPFSHAVRRPEHDPEGVLSIESGPKGAMSDPIATLTASTHASRPMFFALNASTRVAFGGERHVHAWVSHQFSNAPPPSVKLVARARQFSSFILLVGRIVSADTFEPRFGIIVQNKDLLKIPLLLETIPTPKEFRDAIESLSPEQQRFAKAFRAMQLESTLFGVCVIHIKPQLERLLKLDPDSLTKEIKLTQELSSLFIDYQIPSDLLSYDGAPDAPSAQKIARVTEYVARMREMIDASRRRELEEAREREAYRRAESDRSEYGAPPAPSFFTPPVGAPPPMAMAARAPGALADGAAMPRAQSMPSRARAAPPAPAAPTSAGGGGVAPPLPPPVPASVAKAVDAQPAPPQASPPQRTSTPRSFEGDDDSASEEEGAVDYTKLPAELDQRFERFDEDGALRPTIIHTSDPWSRTRQKSLLGEAETEELDEDDQEREKNRAFDLLDALTRSGELSIEHASLHVILAATHRFDLTLLDTVIQKNVNPIEKVERSLLIMGTTIHRQPARELLAEEHRARFFALAPKLDEGVERSLDAESKDEREPGR